MNRDADEALIPETKSRRGLYTLAGAVVAVVVIVLALLSLRSPTGSAAIVQYEELYQKANSLLFDGRNAEAVEAYHAALAVLPDHQSSAGSYNNLGWALQQLGRMDEAIEAYSKAIELDPTLERARNNLAAARRAKPQ